jgi:hypothetical protein
VRVLGLVLLLGLGPTPVASKSPVRPPLELACRTAEDCGFTHFDEACCGECPATVGNRTWVASVDRVCRARKAKGCRVPACGQAFVEPKCVSGQCVR